MNRNILAAAIAATVAATPAAFAESTVYGKMHSSIDMKDYDGYGGGNGKDNWELNSRSSRIGFKGSEDLGGGLKAIYQIELQVNAGGGSDGQGSTSFLGRSTRNTFIGLSGDWGTFLVGRHDTPQKVAFYASGNERLGDSVIDLNLGNNLSGTKSENAPIGVFHEYRADNGIAYVSPNFSGFTFVGAIIPGEDNDVSDSRDGIADHWSVGGMYSGNGLKASVGYAAYDTTGPGTSGPGFDDYEVLQVGASYTMNDFSIGAAYEDTDNLAGVEDTDYSAYAVTGKYTFGNNAVSLVYTHSETEPDAPNSDIESDGWGIAAEHNFSKRTKVYAAYASAENDIDAGSDEDNDVFSLGMIHNF